MTGTVHFVTNCAPVALMVRLLLAPAVETPECRMNRAFSMFLLLPVAAMAKKTIGKCVRQHKRGIQEAVGHCEEFDPVLVHRAKME